MKLNNKLSSKAFFLSFFLIFTAGLSLLLGLYFILNIQYKKPTSQFSAGPVTTPPKSLRLDLKQPDDNSLILQDSTVVSGTTGPFLDILISTGTSDLVTRSKPDGSFSTVLDLDEGVNTITVAVFDATGDFRTAERTVYFSKEKI
ncbi:hypothetical protein KKE03_04675 [Patescibacteria group bacterium]|nr:hypothetical protein [Patescibacteria group bacterium]